jgi:DNA-binding transcriptional regulator YiaG
MKEETRIAVIEFGLLRETIREILREELDRHVAPSPTTEIEYKDTDQLSISQAAKYLGVSTKTVANYRQQHKIPEPEYNLSGKPRWRVAQLKEALNVRKAKLKFPVS